jgi:hypothetical protein
MFSMIFAPYDLLLHGPQSPHFPHGHKTPPHFWQILTPGDFNLRSFKIGSNRCRRSSSICCAGRFCGSH